MAFCTNCGATVSGQFCPKCGTRIPSAPPPAGAAYTPPPAAPPPPAGPGYGAPQPPAAAAPGLTDNLAALLCYVVPVICGIVFLALQPYNTKKFIRFHAFQSIFFGIFCFAVHLVFRIIVGGLISSWSWGLLSLISTVGLLIWLAFLVIWVFLLIKAYQGEMFKLPVIGNLAEKQA
jgi:uncharacterized membrane protein